LLRGKFKDKEYLDLLDDVLDRRLANLQGGYKQLLHCIEVAPSVQQYEQIQADNHL